MKKLKEKLKYGKRGITLIALVVTIIILLILAGITINMVFSDNGIINKAQDAGNKMNEAINDELTQMNDLTSELMEIMGENPRATDIYVFLYDDGTLTFGTQNEPIKGKNVVKEYGNIKGQEYRSWINEDRTRGSTTPWFNEVSSIRKVSIVDHIVPLSMASWFDSCVNLTEFENLERLDTSEVTSMANMFDTCSSLTSLNLNSFDTSNVTNMEAVFGNCSNLANLNLSSFNTSNVTSMSNMFARCSSLTNVIGLEGFNTSKVEDIVSMFDGCSSLTSLNLSSFDTSKVENMESMFNDCTNLIEIIGLEEFDTTKVNNMGWMFQNCSSITTLDLSSFATSNVKGMDGMFAHCTNLTTIYVGDNWDLSNVEYANYMFDGCGTNTTTPKESNS